MKKLWMGVAMAALAMNVVGCDDPSPPTTVDAGSTPDAFVMGTDSGMVGTDSGMVGTDSGMVGTDGGMVDTDGGMMGADGGMMGADGGMMGADGGMAAMVCGDGVVSGTERCDTAIASGMVGACPTVCNDGIACTIDALTGTGCDARCTTTPITACTTGDSCCPTGCTAPGDADCSCVPRTCAAGECGQVDNGCGMDLNCGACAIGRGCDSDVDCASGVCVVEAASGWPGGYCTASCTTDAMCGAGAHCGYRDAAGVGACVSNCTSAGDCRTGYSCRNADADPGMVRECAPTGVGTGITGAACASVAACSGGDAARCITEAAGWQGGYCSRDCRADTDCVGASHCGFIDAAGDGVCLANCGAGGSCRTPGYACFDIDTDTRTECAPAATGTGAVGSTCRNTFECAGGADGFCISDPEWVGGYCSIANCMTDAMCPSGSHCSIFGTATTGVCTANCASDASCRDPGYRCYDSGDVDTRTECFPAATGTGVVGSACEFTWQCAGGTRGVCATEDNGFRNGYCTLTGCRAGGSGATGCPTGSHCSIQSGETDGLCVANCTTDGMCRSDGYRCYDTGDVDTALECWPAATGTGAVGAACVNTWDCSGEEFGGCIPPQPSGDFAGGYCTRTCGAADPACPTGSTCLDLGPAGMPNNLCLDNCTGPGMGDCRATYMCTPLGVGMPSICI